MSSSDHRGIPQGNAAIIAAIIVAIATIFAASIPIAAALFFGVVQISFPLSRTPTLFASNDSAPQPTYTLLPTYTPYPTLVPPRTIVAPKPITVIPTLSTDQQSPLPGSTILAGQEYSKNGVTIATGKSPEIYDNGQFGFQVSIKNRSGQKLIVLWKNSLIHIRDDKNKTYRQPTQIYSGWDSNHQFTVDDGSDFVWKPVTGAWGFDDRIDAFQGPVDPNSKYVIFTIDQLVGMSNMNWRYNFQ